MSFLNVTSILKISVPAGAFKELKIYAGEDYLPLNGEVYVSNLYGTLSANWGSTKTSTTTINISSTATEIYVPVTSLSFLGIGATFTFTRADDTTLVLPVTYGNNIYLGRLYNLGTVLPDELPGLFSVSSTKKVRFSKGNLYYTGSGWALEANQYDYRTWPGKAACIGGTKTTNGTPTGNVGLFYWTSATAKSYLGTYSETGTGPGDTFFANTDDSVIGSNWNALTKEEWNYLLHSRTNAASKIGYATVCGVQGAILLPDTFTDPMKNGGSGAFVPKSTTGYGTNKYNSGADWDAMESAGAVFLPASGYRLGESLYSVGGDAGKAYYWSATAYNNNIDAYSVFISGNSAFDTDNIIGRDSGGPIRLVTTAK